jgi:hypothetical protein
MLKGMPERKETREENPEKNAKSVAVFFCRNHNIFCGKN